MAIPEGYTSQAQTGRFVKLTVAVGDFVHGKIVSRETKHNEQFDKDDRIYTLEIQDAKLTDYVKKDGSVVDQSKVTAGDLVRFNVTAQLERDLDNLPDGHLVYVEFAGKKPTVTKKRGTVDMNTFTVAFPPVSAGTTETTQAAESVNTEEAPF